MTAGGAGAVHAQSATTLKVMDWNIHHGVDTSNVNNLDRVVTWIANINADVVSLNEVEKQNGYNNNADEPAVLESSLETRTGVPWYGCFAQRTGATSGQGNLILSRIPIQSCTRHLLTAMRSAARATMAVNGVTVTVFSTHLDDASASTRATQIGELLTAAASAPGNRMLMGDFNASSTAGELTPIKTAWEDAWPAAVALGTAVSYPANPAGNTRNGRIDYIWRAHDALGIALRSAQVYDTGAISDHRPVAATYAVSTSLTAPLAPANVRVVR
jgi:endonuclease/exonuclease/phosphatase family metal-dependent hydrolase